ncbi:MAG TPA: hypothetical protein VKB26_14860, partial [Candidatus Acidoferrales bacterium]|nr:hypothetical protein [Candidatus Acidoferrales bacterium]
MRYGTVILRLLLAVAFATAVFQHAYAQGQPSATSQSSSSDSATGSEDTSLTVFPHSDSSRFWISGQANIILQWHPSFPSDYTGPNSLSASAQSATSHVLTLYTGYKVGDATEVFLDIEDSTGTGIGNALGLAGYTNLDVVRT